MIAPSTGAALPIETREARVKRASTIENILKSVCFILVVCYSVWFVSERKLRTAHAEYLTYLEREVMLLLIIRN